MLSFLHNHLWKCSHTVRVSTLPCHPQQITKEVSFALFSQLFALTFGCIILLCQKLGWSSVTFVSNTSNFPSCFCLRDTNILHNSHSTLSQNLKLSLAFLWCLYLDLSSSKPLWYFSGWPSSGSSSCRHFCYQHSYKPQTELSDACCSGCFFCQPEFLSNLSSGYVSAVSLRQQLLNFYQIWPKHRNSKALSCKFCENWCFIKEESYCFFTLTERIKSGSSPPLCVSSTACQDASALVRSPKQVSGRQEGNQEHCEQLGGSTKCFGSLQGWRTKVQEGWALLECWMWGRAECAAAEVL